MNRRIAFVPLACVGLVALGAAQLFAAITVSSTNVPLAIPDASSVNSTLAVVPSGTITDANLTVNISHLWDADIQISLAGPTVAAQLLWKNCGSSGDNLTNTVIDNDAAGLAVCTSVGGPPFTGSFQPTDGGSNAGTTPVPAAGSLNAFDGTDSAGTWTLSVADDSSLITGTLNAWSITLDGAPPLPVELMNFEIG